MKKVLVANRGEIARRVIRTLKKMGIKSVAIYSEADENALHVSEADEAVCVGKSPSSESYLQQDKILQICSEYKVDAIHPGYGFLSENAAFVKKVEQQGIVFIGPKASSIEIMGDKIQAKQAVKKFNVPLVPGIDRAISSLSEAKGISKQIGFPILIKASAGGGGKGMRLVEKEEDLEEMMRTAQNEAKSSFGNDEVFIEKFVSKPRHIEIQVFGDSHGNYIYLFERECSIQRRHQKVIEEAPSIILTEELRKKMGEAAISVCKSCNYIGAGTVEFLLDAELNFYFLEMNTRLQVEHPVTEEITKLDLVEWQIRVAKGEQLPLEQKDIKIQGHAFEIRLYAEDTFANFTPDIGILKRYILPVGKNIRVDDAYEEGMEIPIYYDPMLAKLIVWGETRKDALELMDEAIDAFQVSGVKNNLDFCKYVINHPAFISGDFDTNFIKHYFETPTIVNTAMENEKKALTNAFESIWESLKDKSKSEYISKPIHGAWKLMQR